MSGSGVNFSPHEWRISLFCEPEPYYLAIRQIFERNLPRYFSGQEQIGLSLTGGLDTRMILAWRKPLPGFFFPVTHLVAVIANPAMFAWVARWPRRANSYEVIPVGTEFLSRFPHYASARCISLTDAPGLVSLRIST